MKVLELVNFSAGICGVWTRVREESVRLSEKGHEVMVFSSDFTKGSGSGGRAEKIDHVGKVKIRRFPATKLGGESFMSWDFESSALKYNPDVIIAHSYRHSHTKTAVKIAKKLGCRVFLVTHAPFVENENLRDFKSRWAVKFYDRFIGPRLLRKFDKVLAISKWEIPVLLNLGVMKEKIVYIPNGIPEEFFKQKKTREENNILFLGRLAEIKNLNVLIKSIILIKDKKIKLELVGPSEGDHILKLKRLVNKLGLEDRVLFTGGIYDLREKIKKIDSCKIFVLPSKRESMPQSLIEAMARGKAVISSDNKGAKDLISDGESGHLFKIGDEKDLAEKIDFVLSEKNLWIGRNAKKFVEQFRWDRVIEKIERLF